MFPYQPVSPRLFNNFLMGRATFMRMEEMGKTLPSLTRELVPCTLTGPLAGAYHKLNEAFRDKIKDLARRCGGRCPSALPATRVITLDGYLDHPWGWPELKTRVGETYEPVAQPTDLGEFYQGDKDKRLVEIVQAEVKSGRKCAVYVMYTQEHNVRPKLKDMLTKAGLRVLVLPDSVDTCSREAWLIDHADKGDVLIVNPKKVMTGLDLVQFPTLIFYQLGYSTHVLRQASARARRPSQKLPCKVIFLYYQGTVQEAAMALMGEKEAASQALEGVFDLRGLRALMNGGEEPDVLSALAHQLDAGGDARKAWEKATGAAANAEPRPAPHAAGEQQASRERPAGPLPVPCEQAGGRGYVRAAADCRRLTWKAYLKAKGGPGEQAAYAAWEAARDEAARREQEWRSARLCAAAG